MITFYIAAAIYGTLCTYVTPKATVAVELIIQQIAIFLAIIGWIGIAVTAVTWLTQ